MADDRVTIRGYNCRAYRNSGTYESPTWVEVKIIKDVTINMSRTEYDASCRGDGIFKITALGLVEASLDVVLKYRPTNENFIAFETAFYTDDAVVEILFLNGPISLVGAKGLRASFCIPSFVMPQELDTMSVVNMTLKPGVSDNAPAPYTVAA